MGEGISWLRACAYMLVLEQHVGAFSVVFIVVWLLASLTPDDSTGYRCNKVVLMFGEIDNGLKEGSREVELELMHICNEY